MKKVVKILGLVLVAVIFVLPTYSRSQTKKFHQQQDVAYARESGQVIEVLYPEKTENDDEAKVVYVQSSTGLTYYDENLENPVFANNAQVNYFQGKNEAEINDCVLNAIHPAPPEKHNTGALNIATLVIAIPMFIAMFKGFKKLFKKAD